MPFNAAGSSIDIKLPVKIWTCPSYPEPLMISDAFTLTRRHSSKWPTRSHELLRFVENHCMMTSSNGNIFRVTGPLCGKFTGHWWIPRTKASDEEFWCHLWAAPGINGGVKNRRGWWFETTSRSSWRHCNYVPPCYLTSASCENIDIIRSPRIKMIDFMIMGDSFLK